MRTSSFFVFFRIRFGLGYRDMLREKERSG